MITTTYSLALSIVCIVLGALTGWVLYRKDSNLQGTSAGLKWALSCVRAIIVSILCFLLLEPVFETIQNHIEKPIVVVLQDGSQSIYAGRDSSQVAHRIDSSLSLIESKLGNAFSVYNYHFSSLGDSGDSTNKHGTVDGRSVRAGLENKALLCEGLSENLNGKETDIASPLEEIRTRYYNKNLAAVILASDGLYNSGTTPDVVAAKFEETKIYCVGLGDTVTKKDLAIGKVGHNRIAYKGNKFPVEITIRGDMADSSSSSLKLRHNGKVLFEKKVAFSGAKDIQKIEVQLEAEFVGLQRYEVALDPIMGEITNVNNTKQFYVEILESQQKILLIAEAPHPDVKAVRNALITNKNYQVESTIIPNIPESLSSYSLAIVFQLPTTSNNGTKFLQQLEKAGLPCLYILGSQVDATRFNQFSLGLKIEGSAGSQDVTSTLNKNFSLFQITPTLSNRIAGYPPLTCPFGVDYKLSASSTPLLFQRIGMTPTEFPLVYFGKKQESKFGVILGEGIWRWRLLDYLKFDDHAGVDELIKKSAQYLVAVDDKSRFKVYNETEFWENEQIPFEAEVYNKSFELVNTNDVEITIRNEQDDQYLYVFNHVGSAYKLNIPNLTVGRYSYEAKTILDDSVLTKQGSFTIKPLQKELSNVVANHRLLYSMASKNGGELFYLNEMNELIGAINGREDITSTTHTSRAFKDLIEWKFLCFILVILLAIEWFLRKRNGAY